MNLNLSKFQYIVIGLVLVLVVGVCYVYLKLIHLDNKQAISSNNMYTATSTNLDTNVSTDTECEENDQVMSEYEQTSDVPQDLKSFVPFGYNLIYLSSGDANLDGLTDKIMVFQTNRKEARPNYEKDCEEQRPLLLLLGQSDGSYRAAIRNDSVIYCPLCGGYNRQDPFFGITIKDGYFSIEHSVGAGNHWEQITTFKFDKDKNNWFLYKDHFISYKFNPVSGPNEEALIKDIDSLETVKDFGIIYFDKFNWELLGVI
jgi:hypothetical protein